MTEPTPCLSNLHSVVDGMENDILSVGRWADVLMAVGTATHLIEPHADYAIGTCYTTSAPRSQSSRSAPST